LTHVVLSLAYPNLLGTKRLGLLLEPPVSGPVNSYLNAVTGYGCPSQKQRASPVLS
jgi:hypothetical protein